MPVDDAPNGGAAFRLVEILDRFRGEIRSDMAAVENRINVRLERQEAAMSAQVQDVRADINEFVIQHGLAHDNDKAEDRRRAQRWDDFIESSKLASARQQGTIGVVVFVVSTLGRHWQIVVTGVLAVLAMTGSIRVNIG